MREQLLAIRQSRKQPVCVTSTELCVPVVAAGSSFVQRRRDGHAVQTVLVVVSLVELVSDLPDVSGYHHKVSVREADQDVAVTVPSTHTGRERTDAGKTSHQRHCGLWCLAGGDGAEYQR